VAYDVKIFDDFYQTVLGSAVCQIFYDKIKQTWPTLNEDVLFVGYGLPFATKFGEDAVSSNFFIPIAKHINFSPNIAEDRCIVGDDGYIPIQDNSYKYIVVIHALEHALDPKVFLREVWRVLKPEGRVIFIVPNRRRVWSSVEKTPFGHGNPYSTNQLKTALENRLLIPQKNTTALFLPPSQFFAVPRLLSAAEWVLKGWLHGMGGVHFIEAKKQVYGALTMPLAEKTKQAHPQKS